MLKASSGSKSLKPMKKGIHPLSQFNINLFVT